MEPREGEVTFRHDDVISLLEKEGDSIALVLLPSVQYYTGQLFDMKTITHVAQKKVQCLLFLIKDTDVNVRPCCVIPWLPFSRVVWWGSIWPMRLVMFLSICMIGVVDFACWCTYKVQNQIMFYNYNHQGKYSLSPFSNTANAVKR